MTEVFEMLWDCSSCGTTGLLGRSNRHCPHCGAPQDQTKRYFPPEGTDIRVTGGYVYEGVDKVCPSCTTPNGGAADFCKNCGTPLSETARSVREKAGVVGVGAVAPVVVEPAKPPSKLKWIIAAAALVIVAFVVLTMVWKKEVQVRVAGHSWRRDIGIEQMSARPESAWCNQMPIDAYGVSRSREVRSERQIPDGETCTTKRESRGDGSYVNKEECRPKYRSEPVYDDKCRYVVNRWQQARSVTATGVGVTPPPSWPKLPSLRTGSCLGCEREGARSATYSVSLQSAKETFSCDYDEARWRAVVDGTALPMKVRMVVGGADCDSLGQR